MGENKAANLRQLEIKAGAILTKNDARIEKLGSSAARIFEKHKVKFEYNYPKPGDGKIEIEPRCQNSVGFHVRVKYGSSSKGLGDVKIERQSVTFVPMSHRIAEGREIKTFQIPQKAADRLRGIYLEMAAIAEEKSQLIDLQGNIQAALGVGRAIKREIEKIPNTLTGEVAKLASDAKAEMEKFADAIKEMM